MRREIGILTIVLILSLIPTYWASRPIDPKTADQVPLVDLKEIAWKQIIYKDPNQEVIVYKDGEFIWVEHKAAGVIEVFRAADSPDANVVSLLSPLRAVRDLGVVAQENLGEYGLIQSAITLEIELQNGERQPVYQIGIRNFGTRYYFIKDKLTGNVYLVDGSILDVMAQAKTRLFERNLLGSEVASANRIDVKLKGKKGLVTYTVSKDGFDPQGEVSWQFKGGKDASANTKVNTWIDKISKLYGVKYTTITPSSPPVFEMTYYLGDKVLETLQIYKHREGEQDIYLARSHHTQASVEINQTRMAQIEGDLALVFP